MAAYVTVVAVSDFHVDESGAATRNAQVRTAANAYAPDLWLSVGDQSTNGSTNSAGFTSWGTYWGDLKTSGKIRPVPGNHDIESGATNYNNYWGANGGSSGHNYSFDVGGWHVVMLEANNAVSPSTSTANWVSTDLSANRTKPTIVVYHAPRWNIGDSHGDSTETSNIWALFAANPQVEIVISGHEHLYQRFYRQSAAGVRDNTNGVVQFVLPTVGGEATASSVSYRSTCATYGNVAHNQSGGLALRLYPDRYAWQTFISSGSPGFTGGTIGTDNSAWNEQLVRVPIPTGTTYTKTGGAIPRREGSGHTNLITKSGGATISGPYNRALDLLYPGDEVYPALDLFPGVIHTTPDAIVQVDTVAISVTYAPAAGGAVKSGRAAPSGAGTGAKTIKTLIKRGGGVATRAGSGNKAFITLIKRGGAFSARAGSGPKVGNLTRTGGASIERTATGPRTATRARTGGAVLSLGGTGRRVRELNPKTSAGVYTLAGSGGARNVSLQMFEGNAAPPGVELLAAPYIPPERRGLRFIVRNIIDGRVVDWDLPLVEPEITWTLSGPTVIRGSIEPENRDIVEERIDAWATWLDVEENGIIRASGIVQPVSIDDERFEIEAVGVAAYPQGMPFMSELSEVELDAMEAVRRIWAHLLAYPDAVPLNIELSQITCGLLLGTPAYPKTDASGYVVTDASGNAEMEDAKPYELNWWSDIDCGREIDQLAQTVPFDYVERPRWSQDRDYVVHRIELGFPRAGSLRDDLRFVLDENMVAAFVVREQPGTYASQIIVRGAGEGRDGVRGYAGTRSPRRLRRVTVVTDKAVMTSSRADARAADELRRRQSVLTVGEIVVHDWHPNAPIGSFDVGDDIVIQAPVSYLGDVKLVHRITAFTWSPDLGTISLTLARSDDFYYGREPSVIVAPPVYAPTAEESLPEGTGEEELMSDIHLDVAGDGTFDRTVMVEAGSSSAVIAQTWITFAVNGGTAHFEFQAYGLNGSTIGSEFSGDEGKTCGHRTADLANHGRGYITLPNGVAHVRVWGSCSSNAHPALGLVISPKK